jgi:hypothetical protein
MLGVPYLKTSTNIWTGWLWYWVSLGLNALWQFNIAMEHAPFIHDAIPEIKWDAGWRFPTT